MGRHLRYWIDAIDDETLVKIELATDDGHVFRLARRMPTAEFATIRNVRRWCRNEITDEIWSSVGEGTGRGAAALAVRGVRSLTSFPWALLVASVIGALVGGGIASAISAFGGSDVVAASSVDTRSPKNWTRSEMAKWAQSPCLLPNDDAAFVFAALEGAKDDSAVAKATVILSFLDESVRHDPHAVAARHYLASFDVDVAKRAIARDAAKVGWPADRLEKKFEEVMNP